MSADIPQDSPRNEALRQAQQIEADAVLVNSDPVAAARRLSQDAIMLKNDDEQTRQAVIAEMRNYDQTSATKMLPHIWINTGSPYGPGDPSMANDVTIGSQSAFGARPDGSVFLASGDAYGNQGITVSADQLDHYRKSDPVDELSHIKKYEKGWQNN